ncbi:MAG: hypothetical protein A3K19_29620 [Lentisphaerae bacterium RIFOXYB12_FULL_65_16]|nr:MAG: hypothetical protein A3K18_30000 [Lentisphaerae bacterium RIFOXYA12_64_32]OGV87067.1 MAG: hypothetical protein A3K19_29620 [Lentisphaerae bacterium RIFOXYB12_FULL_65_16]
MPRAHALEPFYRELSSESEPYRHHAQSRFETGVNTHDDYWENESESGMHELEYVQHGPKAVAVDANGNVYVVGAHKGTVGEQGSSGIVKLAGSNGFSVSYSDGYIAKMDANGNWLWSKNLRTVLASVRDQAQPFYPRCVKVTTDALYIAGDTERNTADDIWTPSDCHSAAFVAKLNLDGACQWCTFFNYVDDAAAYKLTHSKYLDPEPQVHIADIEVVGDKVLVAGDYSGDHLELRQHHSGGWSQNVLGGSNETWWDDDLDDDGDRDYRVTDIFAVKLNAATGRHVWATQFGFAEDDYCHAVTGDPEGNVYIAWKVANDIEHNRDPNNMDFALEFGADIGEEDGVAFIAKLTSSGAKDTLTELYRFDTDGAFTDLVFANDYLYACGYWRDNIHSEDADADDYDARIDSTGTDDNWHGDKADGFVWRLSPSLWRRQLVFFTGRGEIRPDALTVDDGGNVFVVGRFALGTIEIGQFELSTAMPWSFFAARLDATLNVQAAERFEGSGIASVYGAAVAPLPDQGGCAIVGAYKGSSSSARITFRSGSLTNDLVYGSNSNIYKGFLTELDYSLDSLQQVSVTLGSEVTLQTGDLEPYEGTRKLIKRGSSELTVEVPEYLYYNSLNARTTDASAAVRRYRCDGFTSQPAVVPKPGEPLYQLTFSPNEDATVTAQWTEEFTVSVSSDHADLDDDAGDPALNVTGEWQESGTSISATVDEYVVPDPKVGTRYRCRGYRLTRGGTVDEVIFSYDKTFDEEEETIARRGITAFSLSAPTSIEFLWEKQHRLSVSSNASDTDSGPRTEVSDEIFVGSGSVWLAHGVSMDLSAQVVNVYGSDMAPQTRDGDGDIPDAGNGDPVNGVILTQPSAVVWEYAFLIYTGGCLLGEDVPIEEILDGQDGRPSYENVDLTQNPLVAIKGGAAPVGSNGANMALWGGPEGQRRLYTLRPGVIRVEWMRKDEVGKRHITEVTVDEPSAPEHYRYRHIANTTYVNLEPALNDHQHFVRLEYSTSGARVSESRFTARRAGYAVLLFTTTDEDGEPATGNVTGEYVSVRLVSTAEYNAGTVETGSATVGQEITSSYHDPDMVENGYIFNALTRYNDLLHDRDTHTGPIFPVNDGGDDFTVVWYEVVDDIAWPYKPVKYSVTWPDADDMKVIYIASRMGSEGKDRFGNDHVWPDVNGENRNYLDPARYTDLAVFFQNDVTAAGYNPNEEHAVLATSFRHRDWATPPVAVYALRNDLNVLSGSGRTSPVAVLLQYYDTVDECYRMELFHVVPEFPAQGYQFRYAMDAGEPVVPPYPLDAVIGVSFCDETVIANPDYDNDGAADQRCVWQDSRGQYWAISADTFEDGEGTVYDPSITAKFYYPLDPTFWYGDSGQPGDHIAWHLDFDGDGQDAQVDVLYTLTWPADVPVLKIGETLMFAGGEYASDQSDSDLGLPDVIKWACGQIVYDSLNPTMDTTKVFTQFLARLIYPVELRKVELRYADVPSEAKMTMGREGYMEFDDLHAGLKRRFLYDRTNQRLIFRGLLNSRAVGDASLYDRALGVPVLQPNIMSYWEYQTLKDLDSGRNAQAWQDTVDALYRKCRNPEELDRNVIPNDWTVGLTPATLLDGTVDDDEGEPQLMWGPGLALVGNPALLKPGLWDQDEGYVTILENDDEDLGNLPVTPHIFRIRKDQRYRGSIVMMEPANVFDEKVTLRYSGDFGGNPDELVFEWWYREDDGTNPLPPDQAPAGSWKLFSDPSGRNGLGMAEISMAGAAKVLLVDNRFYCRWRHYLESAWSDWAGSPASRPGAYEPQLAYGWIKRVLDKINPYDARISEFGDGAPATYTSMLRQAGRRYEGPIALNPDPNVIEDYGLIEIYETVLKRARDLSIDLSTPQTSSGVNSALLLATSRIAKLYMLLGNEAYSDALDPTIGFGEDSTEYGSMAPTIFCFQNQLASLLDEELCLLRGRDSTGASPAYNRLLWNFTNEDGEAAYALSYNISDVNYDGFIDEDDGALLYPQGHGDAWGHYLMAQRVYYRLLQHPYFNWEPRTESYAIGGVPIAVDYLDERTFANVAAAKAKAGVDIVSLEYRSHYVEDPDGQWQGYTDTDTDRAWGVTGWARRAGQGALFDWAVANAIVPSEDTEHTGLAKIDRTTVTDIREVSAHAAQIASKLDDANVGLNPLGLSVDVVPMDIDPALVMWEAWEARTHFEQIYDRAIKAVDNARRIFNHTNEINNMLRQVANTTDEFSRDVVEQDRDYRNRLIEIFGTPYEGTIGAGKVYPTGYTGPDIFYYMYVDVNEVSAKTVPEPSASFKAYYKPVQYGVLPYLDDTKVDAGALVEAGDLSPLDPESIHFFEGDMDNPALGRAYPEILEVDYPQTAADFTFHAPSAWGTRKSPGSIQRGVSDLIQAEADLKQSVAAYNTHVIHIRTMFETIAARGKLAVDQIEISNNEYVQATLYEKFAKVSEFAAAIAFDFADSSEGNIKAIAEFLPKMIGTSTDPTAPARGALHVAAESTNWVAKGFGTGFSVAAAVLEGLGERVHHNAEQKIVMADYEYDIGCQLGDVEVELVREGEMRMEIFARRERLRQATDEYKAAVQEGMRLLDERRAYNQKVSGVTQKHRYQDMAFRIFRNDALQKYRAAFDLAARYVYLAAKAYDYETNLDANDPASAQGVLTDIVKQRTLGQFIDDAPVLGRGGLADILQTLAVNFDVLKGQMGFNNPQMESGRFSLRTELFRIRHNTMDITEEEQAQADLQWERLLERSRVDDLWTVPEFRRYCRPFAPESLGTQPGLVIQFSTEIVSGKNFFGRPLGGGDHSYDPTNFATKIRSVGVWFENYDGAGLSLTPRAYLVPAGLDVMLVPTSNELAVRQWKVVDQSLPIPLPLTDSQLASPTYIPINDSLNGTFAKIRRFSRLRCYHDSGLIEEEEMTFDSRLIGRSAWNSRWLLIIPGETFLADPKDGLDTFIHGKKVPGSTTERDGNGAKDIKLYFQTYGYSGG